MPGCPVWVLHTKLGNMSKVSYHHAHRSGRMIFLFGFHQPIGSSFPIMFRSACTFGFPMESLVAPGQAMSPEFLYMLVVSGYHASNLVTF